MLRVLVILLPFALGALAGGIAVARQAYLRYWLAFVLSAACGTMPLLRIADRALGTRWDTAARISLSNAFGCAEVGCGFAGNIAYALALASLGFAAGMLAGGAFARRT